MKLEFIELTKFYGNKCALDHFSSTLAEGVYGLLGPNGAGKSTLMNLLTDNLQRSGGSILFEGRDILKLGKEFRRDIGYMPQQQGMYDEFRAIGFLYYMASMKGIGKRQARVEIDDLLELVGLTDVAHKKVGGFSGGMKQRVLLAQALLGNPKVLILDEPTAGLDPEERIRIRNYISQISENKIVIFATHVVSDIESIAGEVLLLKEGKLIYKASPLDLILDLEGKVAEVLCNKDELMTYQKKYRIGNVYQSKEGFILRIVGDNLPKDFKPAKNINLEDVYLYYLEKGH